MVAEETSQALAIRASRTVATDWRGMAASTHPKLSHLAHTHVWHIDADLSDTQDLPSGIILHYCSRPFRHDPQLRLLNGLAVSHLVLRIDHKRGHLVSMHPQPWPGHAVHFNTHAVENSVVAKVNRSETRHGRYVANRLDVPSWRLHPKSTHLRLRFEATYRSAPMTRWSFSRLLRSSLPQRTWSKSKLVRPTLLHSKQPAWLPCNELRDTELSEHVASAKAPAAFGADAEFKLQMRRVLYSFIDDDGSDVFDDPMALYANVSLTGAEAGLSMDLGRGPASRAARGWLPVDQPELRFEMYANDPANPASSEPVRQAFAVPIGPPPQNYRLSEPMQRRCLEGSSFHYRLRFVRPVLVTSEPDIHRAVSLADMVRFCEHIRLVRAPRSDDLIGMIVSAERPADANQRTSRTNRGPPGGGGLLASWTRIDTTICVLERQSVVLRNELRRKRWLDAIFEYKRLSWWAPNVPPTITIERDAQQEQEEEEEEEDSSTESDAGTISTDSDNEAGEPPFDGMHVPHAAGSDAWHLLMVLAHQGEVAGERPALRSGDMVQVVNLALSLRAAHPLELAALWLCERVEDYATEGRWCQRMLQQLPAMWQRNTSRSDYLVRGTEWMDPHTLGDQQLQLDEAQEVLDLKLLEFVGRTGEGAEAQQAGDRARKITEAWEAGSTEELGAGPSIERMVRRMCEIYAPMFLDETTGNMTLYSRKTKQQYAVHKTMVRARAPDLMRDLRRRRRVSRDGDDEESVGFSHSVFDVTAWRLADGDMRRLLGNLYAFEQVQSGDDLFGLQAVAQLGCMEELRCACEEVQLAEFGEAEREAEKVRLEQRIARRLREMAEAVVSLEAVEEMRDVAAGINLKWELEWKRMSQQSGLTAKQMAEEYAKTQTHVRIRCKGLFDLATVPDWPRGVKGEGAVEE